jgi:F-type H+-transporting ATPase subunit b
MQTASVFILPNGTFFVELLIFLIIVFVAAKYILPPLNRVVEKRQEQIRSSLEAADQARADAAAADDERRAVLEHARQQAREIVAQANHTAEQVRSEAQARGQAESERIIAGAGAELALARQRAIEESASRMGEIVLDTVEKIIGREVDAAAHRDLLDEAIEALRSDTQAGDRGAGARS